MTILQFMTSIWQLYAGDIAVFTFWAIVGCSAWMVSYTLLAIFRVLGLAPKTIPIYENFGVQESRY